MFISSETLRTGQSQIDHSAHSHNERLSTKDPLHYGKVWFEEVGDLCMAHGYRDRQAQIAGMIRLVTGTGTGSRLLADLKALSTQGVRIAIGPRDDIAPDATHIPMNAVSTTVDGEVLWDCNYLGFLRDVAHPTPDTYKKLIGDLTEVRNLAAKKAWPDVPPVSGKDTESAFLAELVLRDTPALLQSEVAGPGGTPRYELGAGHMPAWRNEALRFDSLNNLMPAWLTTEGRQQRDDLIAVLKLIDATSIGKALLNDLWVYGRSRGVMVVHRSGSGKEGIYKLADATVWRFDKSGLAARAQSTALTDREARASGGFLCLLEAHRELADKLGTLARLSDLPYLQRQFEAQLVDERRRHLPADGARVRHGAGSPPSSVASTAGVSLRTGIPVPPDDGGTGLEDALVTGRPTGAVQARAENRVRHWLQNSVRIFTVSRAEVTTRITHPSSRRAVPNPYTPGPARGTGTGV
ncbi:hypothetical protein BOSP111201_17950 [Bordetella sputigena]|uniref:hypothetical protein n=1 Tax=Bordetella sputigena TaxID=1416810 RepID=UPI0039EFBDF9